MTTSTVRPPRRRGSGAHPAIARRRSRVRRARQGRAALMAATALGLAAVGSWLAAGPALTVTDTRVSDYPGPDAGPLRAAVAQAAERGGSLLSPPVGAIRRAAQTDPWVSDVIVQRDWPTGLVVEVIPAEPAAIGVTASGRMLVSADGRSMGPAGSRRGLPQVRVDARAPLALGARVPRSSRATVAFVAALDPGTAARVRDMHMDHGLVIGRLTRGPQIRAGTPGAMPAKAASLMAVLAQVSASEQRAARYIDVSVPAHPALGGPDADPALTRGTAPARPAAAPDASARTAPADPAATDATGAAVAQAATTPTATAAADAMPSPSAAPTSTSSTR
ncbi:MAG: FtsQ-type POTRA domain-containing protein [Thermoleophilia bacterium]|nr:FtsQ-type POTRA domain-containing protein [Thermoleophilia bacterium]